MLADEIVIRPVIHVGLTRGHRVEDLEGADQFAGRLQIDGKLAIGHRGDGVGDTLGCVMHPGKAAAPGGHHGQRALALGVKRRGQRGGRGRGGAADGGLGQK